MDRPDCRCQFCETVRAFRKAEARGRRDDFIVQTLVPACALVVFCVVWMTVLFK